MPKQTWIECLAIAQSNGVAVNTSTAYKSLLPSHAQYTFPAGYFDVPGKSLRIKAGGIIQSNTATAITFIANLASINVFSAAATVTRKATGIICSWYIDVSLTAQSVGSATNFAGVAYLLGGNSTFNVTSNVIPQAGSVVGLNVSTTSNTLFDFGVAWGTSSATNNIQLTDYTLEALN